MPGETPNFREPETEYQREKGQELLDYIFHIVRNFQFYYNFHKYRITVANQFIRGKISVFVCSSDSDNTVSSTELETDKNTLIDLL